jgi:hypothetical protein
VRDESTIHAQAGMLMVLHSWSQRLMLHLHLHIMLPAAGWSAADPNQLVTTNDPKWLPKEKVIPLFREKLLRELSKARNRGKFEYQGDHSRPKLHMVGDAAFLADDRKWEKWIKWLEGRQWKGHCSAPELSSEATLEYLGRYAQKAAIGNWRIEEIDLAEQKVTYRYRDNHGEDYDWGSMEQDRIPALEFIDRYLLHVMPYRMTRVRKFGWWSGTRKRKELPRIRRALGMKQVETAEEPSERDKFDGDTFDEEEEREEQIRIICRQCNRLTMVRVVHYPKPSIRRIMTWVLWPELEPDADQMVLPAVEPYLPGGSLYHEAMGFT